jgi:hypothetical protein
MCSGSAPLTALLLGMHLAATQCTVLLVYNINRHGARNALPKTITAQESTTSDVTVGLLPQGQRQ